MIIFGDMSQFQFIYQYAMLEQAQYELELSGGDSGTTFRRKGHMKLDVADAERFIIALGGTTYNTTSTPEAVIDFYGINADAIASGEDDIDAGTVIYPYTTEKGCKMYYTSGASPADPTTASTEIAEGSGITVVADEIYKVIAYKPELGLISSVITFTAETTPGD